MNLRALLVLACTAFACRLPAHEPRGYDGLTSGLERLPGMFDVWLDRRAGRAFLELPAPDDGGLSAECLWVEGLAGGLGSNPVGLDRGQLGASRVVAFRVRGDSVTIEEPNLAFRARSDDPDEVRAVEEAFARSVLWRGPVEATAPNGGLLVDLTSFLVADAHATARKLAARGQGKFRLDDERSFLDASATLAFPDNLELEAHLTFTSDEPGSEVQAVTPSPSSVTLVQHHSFVRLPDAGYTPRGHDPRSGCFAVDFADYAAPLDAPLDVRLSVRHRLLRRDPTAPSSPAVEPLVYYVDRGAPEPVRSALVEGASWWARAFEAAGFEDAFRVELLPEGVHPLDVRYNVIQWVHRQTRGWSYGGGVRDPRTGEMIKGHVTLGSLRVRQDRLIFEGLLGARPAGDGTRPTDLALARIRQLAAHEVGHTLGLAHNFSASTYLGRASVMDYPAPFVRVGPDGALDLSAAYGVGVGAWDEIAIRWLYTEYPEGVDERAALAGILEEARERGMLYHSDADARPRGAAHPLANLWDNGADPVAALEQTLAVRRVALAGFGRENLAPQRPLAWLEEVLAPVYFFHRYQLDAAAKCVGGVLYEHQNSDSPGTPQVPVPPDEQRRALQALVACLAPAELDLPPHVRELLVPRAPGLPETREGFTSRSAPTFDSLSAAATLARMVIANLLVPERLARVVEQSADDPEALKVEQVFEALLEAAHPAARLRQPRAREVTRLVRSEVVAGLIALAGDSAAHSTVRARAEATLRSLATRWADTSADEDHLETVLQGVERFLTRAQPDPLGNPRSDDPPPGSPIGSEWWGCGCDGGWTTLGG